jgi:predicted DNA-binding transcriptional regulator YafY
MVRNSVNAKMAKTQMAKTRTLPAKEGAPPYIAKQIRLVRGQPASDIRLPPLNNKTAKMHKLVHLLQEHGEGLGIRHLSATLGVDERTVKRYLSDIRRLKFDLVSDRSSGRKSLFHIRSTELTPSHFLPALKKIRAELHAGGNPKYTAQINQLIRFLDAKEASTQTTESLDDSPLATEAYYINHGPFAEADPSPGILKLLEAAIASRTSVRLTYSGYSPGTGEFIFFPYALSLRVGTLYLIGHQAENRGTFKSLSVKRIKRCIAMRDVFTREPFDPAEYYKYCFGQWARQLNENPDTVLLAIKADWLEKYLSESHFHPPGKIIRKGKNVYFELKMVIKPDFVNWVLSHIPDLVPVKPDSLCQEISQRLSRGLTALDIKPE